jgi:voltage-gated potassium channel
MLLVTLNKAIHRRRFRKLILTLGFIVLVLSQMVVPIEKEAGGPIQNWFDGLWWGTTTLTTVGYGDYVPITVPGRVIGMMLQLTGALMFGVTIAMIGSIINRTQEEFNWKRNQERLDQIEQTLERIEMQSGFLVKKEADVETENNQESSSA